MVGIYTKKSHLPRQVGFVLRYKLGRSGLATDCGAGTGRGLVYTSKLPRNRWKSRSVINEQIEISSLEQIGSAPPGGMPPCFFKKIFGA